MGDVLLCSDEFWDAQGEAVVAIDPTIEVVRLVGDEHVTPSDLERVTIAIFSPDLYPRRSGQFIGACLRCPNLAWFQVSFAGTDHPVFQPLFERGVQFNTGSGATAPAIAETVIMYLLALSRDLPAMQRDQAERHWRQRRVVELAGLKVGIVGFGAIGHEIARRAEAMGMQVIGMRRTPDPADPFETWSNDRFEELLGWAEAIVVAAPLTEATRAMFGPDEFARMKPGAWFVNVGRGPIVDEDALANALADGHLGGAGLDVFDVEPLPVESPLWELPNVVITAHCSGDSDAADERAVDIIMENLRRRAAGEPLLNPVG